MKKLIFAAVAIVLMAFSAAPEQVVLKGTLVDTKCYGMSEMNVGNTHKVPMENGKMGDMPNCATACAGMGIPVGILDGGKVGNKVHLIVAPAGAFAEHMAKEARITGKETFPGAIMPEKVEVKGENGKWTEVAITTMM